jgi:hypothetical protein
MRRNFKLDALRPETPLLSFRRRIDKHGQRHEFLSWCRRRDSTPCLFNDFTCRFQPKCTHFPSRLTSRTVLQLERNRERLVIRPRIFAMNEVRENHSMSGSWFVSKNIYPVESCKDSNAINTPIVPRESWTIEPCFIQKRAVRVFRAVRGSPNHHK